MSFSMRCLMSVGDGWKREVRCRVTSITSWLCSRVLRLFMMRTITASTRCFLSSSTVAGTSLPPMAVAPSPASSCTRPPPSWPETLFICTRGTLMRKSLYSKALFTWKMSSSCGSLLRSFSPPLLTRILALGFTYRLMRCRFSSSSGIFVCSRMSRYERLWCLLKSMRMHIWYVETLSSCLDLGIMALRSAEPWCGCHESRRPVCFAR
mmetsp:Transcript_109020/g.352015  ORF Transcript_109020/g.352015 Transcript_109020/m.352015 type:complete len:208 (-) Transcript_109020:268-891(-)